MLEVEGELLARRVFVVVMICLCCASAWGAPRPAPKPAGPAPAPDGGASFTSLVQGRQAFKQGNWAEAVKAFEKAVREDPKNEEAWFLLGKARMQLFQWQPAEDALLKAVALNLRNYNAWVALGECEMSQGKYEPARNYVRRIFTWDTRSFYAYYALGVIDYKEGNLANATMNFDHSRALFGEFPSTWYNLAVCAYNQHNTTNALARINKAVVLEPKKPLYLFLQGWYGFMTNDQATGFLAFRHLFDVDGHATGYSDVAHAFLAMRENKLADARKLVDDAIRKEPELTKAFILRALLEVKDNKKDDAVKDLQEALDLDPLDYDARDVLMHLGVAAPPPHPARLPGQKPATPSPGATPSGAPGIPPSPGTKPAGTTPAQPPPPPGVPH